MMDRWEYSYVYIGDELRENQRAILNELNMAGEEGWEFTGHIEDTGRGTNHLMKRKKSDKSGAYTPNPDPFSDNSM